MTDETKDVFRETGDSNDNDLSVGDIEHAERFVKAYGTIRHEIGKVIVGMDEVIEQLFIAVSVNGHALLVGVPGLAKTLLVSTTAAALDLSFSRIQFTPDLMPSDITGCEVIQEDRAAGTRELKFLRGPVFANMILADEINRTPPKTQAALLEAMQEHQVTSGGCRHPLPKPFFVLATQNPIEQEGTYPLPEAQRDRFMFEIHVDYPSEEEELSIVRMTTSTYTSDVEPVLKADDVLKLQEIVRKVPAADHVMKYAITLARKSRPVADDAPQFVRDWVSWGAGPRASQYLTLAAKARSILEGRFYASIEDVKAAAHPVLRHRVLTNFSAEAEGITPDALIDRLLEEVPAHESETLSDGKLPKVLRS